MIQIGLLIREMTTKKSKRKMYGYEKSDGKSHRFFYVVLY